MSADLLQRAAAVLREHAEKATPGPWDTQFHRFQHETPDDRTAAWDLRGAPHPAGYGTSFTVVADLPVYKDSETEVASDAAYLALMHPPVALALADWLDAIATDTERLVGAEGLLSLNVIVNGYTEAIAVARAILREPS